MLGITRLEVLNVFEFSRGDLEVVKEVTFRSKSESGNTSSGITVNKCYFPVLVTLSEKMNFLL